MVDRYKLRNSSGLDFIHTDSRHALPELIGIHPPHRGGPPKGIRPNMVRPKGSAHTKTREIANRLAERDELPLQVLARNYLHFEAKAIAFEHEIELSGLPITSKSNKRLLDEARQARLDAAAIAEAASRYCHARLQSIPSDDRKDGSSSTIEIVYSKPTGGV